MGHSLKNIIGDPEKMKQMYEDEELNNSGTTAFDNLMLIQKGDKIVLKKVYTEGEGHSKSVLEINAIGEVLGNVRMSYKYSPVIDILFLRSGLKLISLKQEGAIGVR
ncbi:hypothetical protein [Cellulosilyticum ruminicola]|uniref:hypothetical protein n=1 Tax=Cellulosilyticum ruminicola TaxID=425254 RepID=UPI0006D1B48C|nr:hypothetical protein [Cellulosilyticum ruminicola]